MDAYRALVLSSDENLSLERYSDFQYMGDTRTVSGRAYPSFKLSDETDGRTCQIEFIFIQIEQNDHDIGRNLTNAIFDLTPRICFAVGYGESRDETIIGELAIGTTLHFIYPYNSPVKKMSDIRHQTKKYNSVLSTKLVNHCSSEIWSDSFRQRGYNAEPKGSTTSILFYCDETQKILPHLMKENKAISVIDSNRQFAEQILNFRDHNFHFLRTPYRKAANSKRQSEANESAKTKSEDLLYTFITSLCREDEGKCHNFSRNVARKDRQTGAQKIRLVFEEFRQKGNKNTSEFIRKEGTEIWKILRKHLIDGIVGSIRFFSGSIVIEGHFTNRDRALIATLARSEILNMMLETPHHMHEFDVPFNQDELPIYFLEFLDDIETIGRYQSSRLLYGLKQKWGEDPIFGHIAEALSNNNRLSFEFQKCG
ncbi:MAG: hypothetical protein AAF583_09710 [Pseudomonadota bacterium]